ncbi:DUF637 domain-containing protein [Thalassospira sp.]|uniref:two-partner secretion domain-containing protein n=1 Tax=Thalassospira sp. TaxID=1912094 RepID=UPI000C51E35C|nr:DUF637 domain-containing protein [Thalassospira sp.]MBC07894.1 hypothetical protein [Thalassospira sp.]|tara:strand:- start:5244 stop:11228 length:5985 start_codon:yes stop_codon:yes gene_type:complete
MPHKTRSPQSHLFFSTLKKFVRGSLAAVLSFNLVVLPTLANAQAVPDTSQPGSNPTLETAPNGVPVINIATPSNQGVSHNRFTSLDIQKQGMVFNNSKNLGTSQLGGVLLANPNLKNSSTAKIILNEVTGTNASQLNGFAEIFGDRAQFVIANPNGITCKGCGFINTSRTSLTTGTPEMENGALARIDVDGSKPITIEGDGLNAEDATALHLLARTIKLNAPINAKELKLVAGRNLIEYGAEVVTSKVADGSSKPALAIDASHFGAMYADRISVLANEDGVGVKMPENMASGLGDISITADGKIAVTNAAAAKNFSATSSNSDVEVNGTVSGGKDVNLEAQQISNTGKIVAGLDANGTLQSSGTASLIAQTAITNSGKLIGAGKVVVKSNAGSVANTGGATISSNGTVEVSAANDVNNSGNIVGEGDVEISANNITNDNGLINSKADLSFTAATLTNQNTQSAGKGLQSSDKIDITADQVVNSSGQISATNLVKVAGKTAGQELTITGGKVDSNGNVDITADAVDTSAAITTQGNASITAQTGNLTQTGTIKAGDKVVLRAQSGIIENGGTTVSVNKTSLTAKEINNTASGTIKSGGNATVLASDQFTNAGQVSSQTDLSVQSSILENDKGALLAIGNIDLLGSNNTPATRIANRSGVIETLNGDISITASEFINERKDFSVTRQQTYSRNEGTIISIGEVAGGVSTQYLEYNETGVLFFRHPDDPSWLLYYDYGPILVRQYQDVASSSNAAAYLSSGGNLTVNADTIRNAYSHISADGDISMTGDTLSNVGQILTKQTTVYKGGGYYNRCQSNKGCQWLLNGAGESQISSVEYDTVDATIQAGGQFQGDFTGQVDNETILGAVSDGDRISANSVQADITEVPPQTSISLVDFFDELPAKDALTQLAPSNTKAVFESRAEFSNPSVVLGGDYFLSRVDLDLEDVPERFAFDQALEERLVQNAIRIETGQRWLDPSVQDASLQLKQLVDGGIAAQESLNLTVGVELTAEQINSLTQNIVWYVEEEINAETVLAPKLYLANASDLEFAGKGGQIIASSVAIDAAGINNSGDIVASNGDVNLAANDDINISSGRIKASDDITLDAGGAILVETDTTNVRTANGGSQSIVGRRASLDAGASVNLDAAEEIALFGADVTAEDDVSFSAGSSLIVGATAVEENVNWGDDSTYDRWSRTSNRGSNIQAGGEITSFSVDDTIVQGSELTAGEDINLLAVGNVAILTARDTYDYEMQRNGGEKSGTGHSVSNVRSELTSGGDIQVTSLTGDITAQAAKFESLKQDDGTVTLNAEQGQVSLISATDEESWTFQSSKSNAVSFKMRDAGAIDTNVVMTEVTADGGLIVNAGNGVVIEYRDTGNLEDSVDALASTPGLEWMADMMARDDATWKAVQEIHKSWDYKAQGLSGPAAAVIAIAVTAATYGGAAAAGGAFATNLGMTATVNGVTTLTASGVAVQSAIAAGLSSLTSQAAVSLIGNGGDIGAVLEQLGSSSTIRSLATTMVTAGVLSGIGAVDIGNAFGNETLNKLATRLVNNSVRNAISSSINTVVAGDGEFGDNLLNALQSAAVLAIGATAAEGIGELRNEDNLDYVSHKLAHAALGCAIAVGAGGDCAGGAIGAAAGEVAGELYFSEERQQDFAEELKTSITDDNLSFGEAALKVQKWKQQGLDVARLAGALSAFIAGADVNSADTAATNATENNLCGTGACATGLALLLSAAYTYTVAEGEGDFYAGLGEIGRGEDFLSEMSAAAVSYGIEGAYAVAPDTTTAVLQGLAAVGELESAVVTYVDDVTGNVISRNWNAIPQETRDQISGGVTFATVVIPSTTIAKLAPANVNVTGAALAKLKKNWPGGVPNRIGTQADIVDHFQQNRQFWSQDPVQFNGNKVYQRNDLIDPNKIDVETGLTNQQLMAQGYAPYGPDGRKINLHHMIQKQNGAIAEMTATFHQQNSGTIHINTGRLPSGINRSQFDQWRKQYWINRANDF